MKYRYCFLLVFMLLATLAACSKDDGLRQPKNSGDAGINVVIDTATTYQTISGFGGANGVFRPASYPNTSEAEKAFGTGEEDLGLSIFRIKLPYNTDDWQALVAPVLEAMKYNVKILASPWSPPPGLKNNNDPVRGELLEENYADYVDHINAFVEFMESKGVDLYAISIQNEPDWEATYESCDWTAAQMRDFLANFAGDIDERVKVAAPESLNFSQSFTNTLLNDDAAAKNFDIAAGHLYGGGLAAFPVAEQKGKDIWMTEYLLNLDAGDWENASDEDKWDETLRMLNSVHQSMQYNWNAYVWWYLKRYYSFIGDGEQGSTEGEILKRGYAFSHFSKFIRPGYQRVDVDEEKSSSLNITAYKGDENIVVVIINPVDSPVSKLNFSLAGTINLFSATSYTTKATVNREKATLDLDENQVTFGVAGKSVTTVVLEI